MQHNTAIQKNYALIFMGMYSTKFGQLEHYNLSFAKEALKRGLEPVYIYNQMPESSHYLKQLDELKIRVLKLDPDIGFFSKVVKIRALIKQFKPKVVHSHFRGSIIRPVIYTAYFMGITKRFNTFHCKIYKHKIVTKIWMKSLHFCCTRMFAVSDAIRKEQIEKMKAPTHKISTLRLGVNTKMFSKVGLTKEEVRKKYHLPKDGLLLANVAFHHPEKGIDVLLEALKIINHTLKEKVYLCQIGQELSIKGGYVGTEYSKYLKNKAKFLGVDKSIIWMGVQNNVPEILSAIDIYVHPSREEGLGLILLEAFCAQIPVVASNVGGIPEVVNNDRGYLIEKENPTALAKQIAMLINSERLREKKGKLGFTFVDKHFNLESQISAMLDYYCD